jgi:hypothetical protein
MTANYRSVRVWAIRLPQRLIQPAQALTHFLAGLRGGADASMQQ